MRWIPGSLLVVVGLSGFLMGAEGEDGFFRSPPADRGISPLIEEDPYYDCAAYGYQLSGGACAPGRPPPSRGWAAAEPLPPEPPGYGWQREHAPPEPFPGRGFGGRGDHAAGAANPWHAGPAYEWVPDYLQWQRGAPEQPAATWGDEGPGWGPPPGAREPAPPTERQPAGRSWPAPASGAQPEPPAPPAGDEGAGIPVTTPWDPWFLGDGADAPGMNYDDRAPALPAPPRGPATAPGAAAATAEPAAAGEEQP